MTIDADRELLSQTHNLKWIRRDLKTTDLLTVYQWPPKKESCGDYFILSELISQDQVEQVLSEARVGNPYGDENEIAPLVIPRSFNEIKEDYNEISEEFRLFHNLYHDRQTDTYIKIDEVGNEKTVAVIKPDEVQMRLKELRQFLAVKEMYLSILFEFNEYSRYSLKELRLREIECEFKREELICWRHDYCGKTPYKGLRSDSRLRGRILIKPLPKSKSGFGGFSGKPEQYAEFIVDVDENGDEVYHTCNPYKLKKISGENPDAPWDFTPIHFCKQVLDKYYNEPSKYTVENSMISCGSLWSMKVDDDHPDKVCVFLRELHRLPYREQLHWKSHNIPPEGGVSRSFFERNVEGKWVSSDQPDILFKQSYEQLQQACDEYLGWQLLKPLGSGDEYRFQHLRVPTVDEESHFKGLVSDLSSLLIERLNEKRLKGLIPANKRKEIKRGINLLEYVLDSPKVKGTEKHIIFLRCLWDLRTTRSSAHPEILNKKEYERASAHFDLESLNRQEAFAKILEEAVEFLDFLISVVRSGKLSDEDDGDC